MNSTEKPTKILKQLNQIYLTIPTISCQHCHTCDGPIIWFYPENINIKKFLKTHKRSYITWSTKEFKKHHMQCPYLESNQCSIYPVRPLVCRLQGIIPELPCHQGLPPILTAEQLLEIKNKFNRLFRETKSMNQFFTTRKYQIQ